MAAKNPSRAIATPILPSAIATGSGTCESDSTCTPAGRKTTAATAAIESESAPPSGKPRNTLSRIVPMSLSPQCSSTPPLEKKKTSYGVIAAPKRATA